MGGFNLKIVDFSEIFYSKPTSLTPSPSSPEVAGNALLGTSGSTLIIAR